MTSRHKPILCAAFALTAALAPSFAGAQDSGGDKPAPETPAPAEPVPPPRQSAPPSPDALSKGSPATPPQGLAREQMWPAASAEEWKKPVLITFQRTWDDALAISKETKKQILVCVNMDGEIASEHYAGVRYRQPEIAKLYEPYVCVIASVYRHNPRDYDDEGRRVICPRFGSVTCGEHIAIEPLMYEKFLDGKRIAPRHICVDLEGKEKYDVYYANDTASIFLAIREGVPADQPPTPERGDRAMPERVASRDVADRNAVETAYQSADAAARRSMLEAALAHPEAAPLDLLRLAVFGFDPAASKQARQALAQSKDAGAVDVIVEALRVPMDDAERDALLAALSRFGETSTRAQWLAVVHQGLAGRTSAIDVKGWTAAGGTYDAPKPAPEWSALESERARSAEAAKQKPEDASAKTALAESYLALAMEARRTMPLDPKALKFLSQNLLDDARTAAAKAEVLGGANWRTNTVIALSSYYGGKPEEAYPRAEAAVKDLPAGEPSWNSMAVLTVFAESRWKAIQKAVRAKERWSAQLLTDLNAANSVLLKHPLGTSSQTLWHYDFLTWLGASDQAARFLREGVTRFPAAPELHDRFRRRLLGGKGVDALEPAYAEMLAQTGASPPLDWFSAIASRIAADFHRRAGAREKAIAAYDRAAAAYERAIVSEPSRRDSADDAIALVLASRARLAYDLGDDDRALADILASFARRPASAGSKDGGGMTPGETAQMLRARLIEKKRDADVQKLNAVLATIDPDLLRFDRE